MYRDELNEWEENGVIEVRRAYSRAPEESEGCKYVQDRIGQEKERLLELWKKGAKVYVCGSRGVADSAREAVMRIRKEVAEEKGKNEGDKDVEKWFEELRNVRYVTDVFD